MSKFTFTNPINGQLIELEGPPTLTEAQASQIFKQQLDAGSLVGLKPGAIISSATQLSGGLTAAAGQVTQALSGIGGSAAGALTGALTRIGSLQAASALPVKDLVNQAQSMASRTLAGVSAAINNIVPTNGINIADLAKQATSLVPIQGLDQVNVRSAMAQASKLVGQASDVMSNTAGVGKFGLGANQLEAAGILKPGTVSTYLSDGVNSMTSVLNSPGVWTGVGGITDVDKLLASVPAQDRIQQTLMSTGLSAVKSLGIPISQLNPQALAGTALNAAKSITDTMSWAQGLPLPSGLKTAFDQASRDAAFAISFANTSADGAVLQEEKPEEGTDTADRATIDAAADRITGNDKIPDTDYGNSPEFVTSKELQAAVKLLSTNLKDLIKGLQEVGKSSLPGAINEKNPARLIEVIGLFKNIDGDVESVTAESSAILRQMKFLEKETGKPEKSIEAALDKIKARIDTVAAAIEEAIMRRKKTLDELTS